jgi:hypothetical protein
MKKQEESNLAMQANMDKILSYFTKASVSPLTGELEDKGSNFKGKNTSYNQQFYHPHTSQPPRMHHHYSSTQMAQPHHYSHVPRHQVAYHEVEHMGKGIMITTSVGTIGLLRVSLTVGMITMILLLIMRMIGRMTQGIFMRQKNLLASKPLTPTYSCTKVNLLHIPK